MRPQPLIAVEDVEASSAWYQRLLGCRSGHGRADYERLVHDGEIVLQLHRCGAHEHPHMGDENTRPYGNGVLLWFQVDDFDEAVDRAGEIDAEIVHEPHVNRNAGHQVLVTRSGRLRGRDCQPPG